VPRWHPWRLKTGAPVRALHRDGTACGCSTTAARRIRPCRAGLPQRPGAGLLAEPSAAEREVLGAIRYQRNDTVLHTDASLLPKQPKAWAAWNALRPA
jgi:uncharacterized protein